MKDYIARYRRRARQDRKRRAKLLRKIQKARAIDRRDEVLALPTWNERFRRTMRLRVSA